MAKNVIFDIGNVLMEMCTIFPKEWLSGVERGTDILDNADVPVRCEQDVEQLSLWD